MKVIEFCRYTKRNGAFVLNRLNFHVEKGYITGLIGPNGSGKTTLIRAIMNLIHPDEGEVRVFGQSYRERERDIKRRIGFVYDEDVFYNHLSVKEMKKIIASFYPDWQEALFQQYLHDFQLPEQRKIHDLSKGMRMKFALAAALAHEPELLIMDEPTSGLDSVFRREVLAILSRYIEDGNRSVLFSTHISTDLERIADYIVHIRNGQLMHCGSKEELLDTYVLVKGSAEDYPAYESDGKLLRSQQTPYGFEGLMSTADFANHPVRERVLSEKPSLDDILYYTQEGR